MSYAYPTTLDAGVPVQPYGQRSPSPYMQSQQIAAQPQSIQPGTKTYTQSIGPDGVPIYHVFVAEKASIRGPHGVIYGIQWVQVDSQYDEPQYIQPASVDWIHQWAKNRNDPHEEEMWREWLRMEEKRRRREEKQRKEYERGAHAQERRLARKGSFSGGPVDQYGNPISQPKYTEAPLMTSGNYLSTAPEDSVPLSRQRRLSQSRGTADALDMERRMREMELGDDRRTRRKSFSYDQPSQGYGDYTGYGNEVTAGGALGGGVYPPGHVLSLNSDANRRVSPNYNYSGIPVQAPIADRPRSPYGITGPTLTDRPRSPYAVGPQLTDRPRSPYTVHASTLTDRPRSPYSSSNIMDRPRSPNYSYSGVTGPGYGDVVQRTGQILFPEAFTRLPTFAERSLSTFAPFLITWLDSLAAEMPRLPALLVPHDVSHEDWIRFMSDLTSVWLGKTQNRYPYAGSRQPRKSTLAASLIDSWNSAYFLPREIELVLVKGKTRFSGTAAGLSDPRLTRAVEETLNEDLDYSDSDSVSDLDDYFDESDTEYGGGGYGYDTGFGFYGRGSNYKLPGNERWMAKASKARRKWIERKRQDKKMNQRREKRRREQSIRKKYSLYVMPTI